MTGFWMGRKVIVTGSEGLIGRPVVRMLLAHGADVKRFDIQNGQDICELAHLEHILLDSPPAIVIHLAALSNVGECRTVPHLTFEVLTMGTVNVLEACRLHPVDALVVASSNHVYGDQGMRPATPGFSFAVTVEDDRLNHLDTYAAAKICADYMARSYAKVYSVPVSIVRNTNCFGPDDPHSDHLLPSIITSFLKGEAVTLRTDGKICKSYLYVDDVAEAYLQIAQWTVESGEKGEVFNISGTDITAIDLVHKVAEVMGVKPQVHTGDPATLEYDEHLHSGKALELVGWTPSHTLDEAIALTVAGFERRMKTLAEEREGPLKYQDLDEVLFGKPAGPRRSA